ncbi:hypothetical protein HUT18_23330 [Streptomyces sp. NA04227]|uniref:hypothetical protein n=1 Tax=Streptomyces sp. NA04227 TaxID=2742136 RepID=UPI0015914462|nr:hypothetical protein [Streptomyces sp. NA04227]QKW08872.1 hypothetical protein HUT18_23330 [Streptomyces sp. NA04227]
MNLRHTMKGRRALTAVALTTGLVLAVAGCGGDGDDKDPKSEGGKSSAPEKNDDTAEDPKEPGEGQDPTTVQGNGISVTVTSAVREQGGFLTLSGQVTNNKSGIWVGSEWRSDESELKKNGGSLAGASLVDSTGKKKYLVLRDTQGRCLCTVFQGGIDQGETIDWFAQFPAPPEGTAKVQLQLPTMPPANIEITEGE